MNISKEQFAKLAKEHLIALESYKMDKNGNKPIEIFGIEKLYEAINAIQCCKSDSEQLPDVYLQELSKVEWTPQTQASLDEQLQILRQFANKLGLYDASDYLKK